MSRVYSTYEAKAKFSEILRQVRQGRTITISYHGEPVAEIRPIAQKRTLEERWQEMEERGVLIPPRDPEARIRPIARIPGALERFLRERHGE